MKPHRIMKSIPTLVVLATLSSLFPLAAKEEPAKPDGFEEGMRQAFVAYKKGDHEAVTAKLRELLKLMEEKGAAEVGKLLPDLVDGWKGESLKRDDFGALGGGISMSRTYVSGERRIVVKVIKDSPVVKQLLPLIGNEDLLRLGNRKTHRISGGTAIMEGEHKLQMVLDERIYLELAGDEATGEKELVGFARKLDLGGLAKMK